MLLLIHQPPQNISKFFVRTFRTKQGLLSNRNDCRRKDSIVWQRKLSSRKEKEAWPIGYVSFPDAIGLLIKGISCRWEWLAGGSLSSNFNGRGKRSGVRERATREIFERAGEKGGSGEQMKEERHKRIVAIMLMLLRIDF